MNKLIIIIAGMLFHLVAMKGQTNEGEAEQEQLVLSDPEMKINFGAVAMNNKVERIFVRSNGGERLISNSIMKNYASSVSSDVVAYSVPEGATEVVFPLDILRALSSGVTITLQCEGGKYYTVSDSSPVKRGKDSTLNTYSIAADKMREGCWMSTIPSNVKYNMVTIPGAHDAATSKVTTNAAKTQSLTIEQQLKAGVRAFDLRPRYTSNKQSDIELENLEIYHGIIATGVKFKDAMDDMVRYLEENPTEALFVYIQKEDTHGLFSLTDQSATWRTSIRTWLEHNSKHVVQKVTADMTLGDCRGKIVVLSRNPYGSEGVYYDKVYGGLVSWDDNTKSQQTQINYTNSSKVADLTVEDFYSTSSVADKKSYVEKNLSTANGDNSNRWYITYASIANNPSNFASQMNPYMVESLESYKSRLGIVMYDYVGSQSNTGVEVLNYTIAHNYKYVYSDFPLLTPGMAQSDALTATVGTNAVATVTWYKYTFHGEESVMKIVGGVTKVIAADGTVVAEGENVSSGFTVTEGLILYFLADSDFSLSVSEPSVPEIA